MQRGWWWWQRGWRWRGHRLSWGGVGRGILQNFFVTFLCTFKWSLVINIPISCKLLWLTLKEEICRVSYPGCPLTRRLSTGCTLSRYSNVLEKVGISFWSPISRIFLPFVSVVLLLNFLNFQNNESTIPMEATVTQIPFNASTCPHYRLGHLGDFNARAHRRCSGSAKSLSWCRGWIIRWAGNRWWQVGSSSGIVAQRPVWEGRGQTGRTRGYSCQPLVQRSKTQHGLLLRLTFQYYPEVQVFLYKVLFVYVTVRLKHIKQINWFLEGVRSATLNWSIGIHTYKSITHWYM